MKGSHSRAADRDHLYVNIAKSGYLFHAVGNVLRTSIPRKNLCGVKSMKFVLSMFRDNLFAFTHE